MEYRRLSNQELRIKLTSIITLILQLGFKILEKTQKNCFVEPPS